MLYPSGTDGFVLSTFGTKPFLVPNQTKWLDRKYVSWEDMLHEEVADNEFTEIF
jgi:hypothetical protein